MIRMLVSILLFLPILLSAQVLKPMDAAGAVTFTINNFGSGVDGSFRGLKGKIEFNPDKVASSSIMVTVDAATIETGINMRNRHLRGDKYFDAEKFPLISIAGSDFKSTGSPDTYNMTAKLTIKGISKSFLLTFTARQQKDGVLFEGRFNINRRDFNVGGGSISLSEEVRVRLKVLAKQ
ncbi:YceI family protein [Flavihumibacter sp. UBA7668]|uniref:YceI family protein n=1 Tax=Flavihumibacter sp. UBA7668 TaxID=1946542 RepID=UPI0025B7D6AF|nr:YceI family protein [Flavihumibacter sp. UBA7668]